MSNRALALPTLIFLIQLCGSAGCVSSLHPLHEKESLHFDAGLVGVWSGNGKTLTVEQAGKNAYTATVEQEGQKSVYLAHLTKLGDSTLVDLFQEDEELERLVGGEYFPLLVRVHLICRIQREGDLLRIAPLDADWMEKEIEGGDADIPHEQTGDGLILTASSQQLREFFLRRTQSFDQAFPDMTSWRREPHKSESKSRD